MRSEHRAPFVASIIVVLACFGVMAHAVRTDALGGIARHTPMGLIASQVLVPEPAAEPVEAPQPVAAAPVLQHRSSAPARAQAPSIASKAPATVHVRPAKPSPSHAPTSGHVVAAGVSAPAPQQPPATPSAAAVTPPVPSLPATPTLPTHPGRGHGHATGHGTRGDTRGHDDRGHDNRGHDSRGDDQGHGARGGLDDGRSDARGGRSWR